MMRAGIPAMLLATAAVLAGSAGSLSGKPSGKLTVDGAVISGSGRR